MNPAAANICDGCGRMLVGVRRTCLLVDGAVRTERDLCRACLCEAVDAFMAAHCVTISGPTRTRARGARAAS